MTSFDNFSEATKLCEKAYQSLGHIKRTLLMSIIFIKHIV